MSLLSNIMLKISCIYWRRSISSWPADAELIRTGIGEQAERRLHRRLGRNRSHSPRRIAGTLGCRVQRPPGTCCRQGQFGHRCIWLSDSLCPDGSCETERQIPFIHGCSKFLSLRFLQCGKAEAGVEHRQIKETEGLRIQVPHARGETESWVQAS